MKKRLLAIGAVVCALLCAAAISGSAETPAGARDGQVVLISEPDAPAADLTAFRQGQPIAPNALDWADGGVHGQALQLNGQSDYLEYTGAAVRAETLSGVAWINWQGSVTDDASGEIGQRLWTLYRDEDNYFSVCLRGYRDNIKETEDGTVLRVDGVYMEYKLAGVMGRHVEAFNPTARDVDYAIPKNTWTHLAFTLNDRTMRLYIGGRLWFEEEMENAATLLDAAVLQIGGSLDGGPTLHALIDDAALFAQGLDTDSIRALAQGAALDFTGATEPTVYRPTRPTEPELDAEEDDDA
ncbi:MAG: LamG domain-containing protein, partial [Clostridia bacterium]|nr:LamG domain-containing protein [Clostridia bacterium]